MQQKLRQGSPPIQPDSIQMIKSCLPVVACFRGGGFEFHVATIQSALQSCGTRDGNGRRDGIVCRKDSSKSTPEETK